MTSDQQIQGSECPTCEGEGMVLAHMAITSPVPRVDLLKCPLCDGTGRFPKPGDGVQLSIPHRAEEA